jgi:hypothetical protein
VVGERDVLPGATGRLAGLSDDREPGGFAKLGVLGAAVRRPQRTLGEVGDREVRDGIAPRPEEHDRVVGLDHGPAAQLGAHPAPQRLSVEHPLRHAGYEEPPVRVSAQRPLLP